jgi:hypothetical protein
MLGAVVYAHSSGTIALGGKRHVVTLQSADRDACERVMQGPLSRVTIELKQVKAQDESLVVYRVYLGSVEMATPGREHPAYVGDVNFFGTSTNAGRAASLDATDAVHRLGASKALACPVKVTFVADIEPAAPSRPRIAAVQLWISKGRAR